MKHSVLTHEKPGPWTVHRAPPPILFIASCFVLAFAYLQSFTKTGQLTDPVKAVRRLEAPLLSFQDARHAVIRGEEGKTSVGVTQLNNAKQGSKIQLASAGETLNEALRKRNAQGEQQVEPTSVAAGRKRVLTPREDEAPSSVELPRGSNVNHAGDALWAAGSGDIGAQPSPPAFPTAPPQSYVSESLLEKPDLAETQQVQPGHFASLFPAPTRSSFSNADAPALATLPLSSPDISPFIVDASPLLFSPARVEGPIFPAPQSNDLFAGMPTQKGAGSVETVNRELDETRLAAMPRQENDASTSDPKASENPTGDSSGASKKEGSTPFKKAKDYDYEATGANTHHVESAHGAEPAALDPFAFSSGPTYSDAPYRADEAQNVYASKHANRVQRPWVELFRPLYERGPIPPSSNILGETNLVNPRWLVYGDWRSAMAYVDNGGNGKGVLATRLNLDLDMQFTSTERVHAFIGPLDRGQNFTRFEFGQGKAEFFDELDADFDNLFFEGDLGALVGGATGRYAPFTLPFAVGFVPLLFQNGIWMEDNFLGAAVTIPARNNPTLQWANFDWTFFTAIDEINSRAFGNDDSAATVYGSTIFIEAYTGYFELGYAYIADELRNDLSYHNLGISWTDRFRDWFSYSLRYIANMGQTANGGDQTADGSLILLETSLITAQPYTVVPYANFFVGLDRPQSVARNGNAGDILRNTGIVFESDFLTGYPTLNATANDVVGGAFGLNLLGANLSHQIVTEAAVLQTLGKDSTRNAAGNQYGFGVRYQRPISNAWLIRTDAMYGVFDSAADVAGARIEIRHKF